MGRLIDADAFEKFIEQKYKDAESTDDIKDQMLFDLSYQPTAYDVEKVLAELEEMQDKAIAVKNITVSSYATGMMHKAISVVRNGGKE